MSDILKELEVEPFNIKKDQCNVKYMSIVTCIHLEGFIVNILNVIEFNKTTFNFTFLFQPSRNVLKRIGPIQINVTA